MPLEPDFEAAARKLCKIRLIAPDTLVRESPTNPAQRPAWMKYAEEIRIHHEVQTALNGSWVMKKEAGAPPAEELSYV